MAGKVYKNNLQLEHAWAAGALIGTNPHPSGSEAWDAWNDGFSGIRT
jgi:hypothetical protein